MSPNLVNVDVAKELKNIRAMLVEGNFQYDIPRFNSGQLLFVQFAMNYMRLVKREIPADVIQALGSFELSEEINSILELLEKD